MATQLLDIGLKRDELQRNLGGGLPTGAIALIEGNDGGGKSIVAQRIAYALLKNGHTASYVSTELGLGGFLQQMDSLDYRITDKIISEELVFISMFPQLGNVKLKKTFMNDLLKSKKIFGSEVIVFDTISFLVVSEDLGTEGIFKLIAFIKKIVSMGKTLIMCIDPEQCNPKFLNIIRNISEIYLQTESKMVLGNLLHVMNVIRFRKAKKEVTNATPFKVVPGAGFAIELASLA
jgi:archaeal flagellar protein FlaH